jgi:hypothetical protein
MIVKKEEESRKCGKCSKPLSRKYPYSACNDCLDLMEAEVKRWFPNTKPDDKDLINKKKVQE